MTELIPPDLTVLYRVALSWFLLTWLGYGLAIHAIPWGGSITARMNDVRRAWMHTMLVSRFRSSLPVGDELLDGRHAENKDSSGSKLGFASMANFRVGTLGRDNRITDASLIGHTVHSATSFASTTVVALAALLGMLGGFDHSFAALDALAFTAKTSRMLVEAKLLLLVVVFAHTFLKLSWALRQLNYCLALLGAAPPKPDEPKPNEMARDSIAEPIATMLCLAIRSFNAGIRGYLFALAVLAWLLGPGEFLLATTGIVLMLLWRQFGSATAVAIRHCHAALVGAPPSTHATAHSLGLNPAADSNGPGRALAMRMQP